MKIPHDDPMWPDAYDHCDRCEQIKVKNDMVATLNDKRLCVECAAKHIQHQQQTIIEREKSAAELKNRVEYLERTIRLAYVAIQ